MANENLEAPNPFNQTQLQESDSLNFKSDFWKEVPVPSSGAYDDPQDQQITTHYTAYDDSLPTEANTDTKPNAISKLFNNMKSKLQDKPQHNSAYDDNAYTNDLASDEPYEAQPAEPTKPSIADSKSSNLLTTNQITMTHEQLDKKESYLDKREKQLLERKRRLQAVKHELESSNIRRDNWPCTYYPITFHSIQQEIPPHARSHMKRMYMLVLLTFLCFAVNTFGGLILYFNTMGTDSNLFFAVIYLFLGICGAWRLWYRQIYYGIRDRKTIKWWCFFFFFAAHIGFCVAMALGIEGWGGAGIITMVNAFQDHKSFTGFVCLISSLLWGINALLSGWYMKKSWIVFKQRGGVEASRGEVANAVARHAVDQLV
eukprot:197515_1